MGHGGRRGREGRIKISGGGGRRKWTNRDRRDEKWVRERRIGEKREGEERGLMIWTMRGEKEQSRSTWDVNREAEGG